MKKSLFVALVLAVPAVTLSVSSGANANPRRLVKQLVNAGALTQADVDSLKGMRKDMRGCRQAVRAGQMQKGACIAKAIGMAKNVKGMLERALTKVERKGLQRKVRRALRKISRRIVKMERRLAAQPPAAPVAPPVAPPPAP